MADTEAQSSTDAQSAPVTDQSLPDRTTDPKTNGEANEGKLSKSAQKKAAKQEKLAAEKADKSANKTTPKTDGSKREQKPSGPRGKKEGADEKEVAYRKEENFAKWFEQVITKGDMIDYYDISGCYILKPAAWAIWEDGIQAWFNKQIKKMGVKNQAFPMFVSQAQLEKEKAHIEGFAAEVAWVTHAGKSKLEQPIAIRPTSETVIYPYFSKWIRSHRDLPYKMNQWNSVVRWEFKHPQPFLRSREFYWQEGHTAHLTKEDAGEEVLQILEHYAGVFEKLLAVPVIRGKKTEKEKFAGSEYSMTVEGYIPATGRGIQGATSHCLGQHFSKMYNISVEDPSAKEGEKKDRLHVWQNSWGLSTRVIGVMVMTHGDNLGLVLPPRVAEYQVVIIPVGINVKMGDAERASLYAQIDAIAAVLAEAHVWDGPLRLHVDKRDYYSPGWKFAEWEQKGVPLRIEVGPGEIAGHYVSTARRDLPGKTDGGKGRVPITELGVQVPALLERIQADLYARAEQEFRSHTVNVTRWDEFVPALNAKNVCLIPHCLVEECEDEIKKLSARKEDPDDAPEDEKAPSMGAKSLCIPFEQPEGIVRGETKCTNPECGRGAEKWVLFGRSY